MRVNGLTIRDRFLGWLLHLANAHARSRSYRVDFYDLKDRLLRQYGAREERTDVQRIRDKCWDCGGTGASRYMVGAYCSSCGRTGIYRTRWIALERWTLGGRVFHRPTGPTMPRAIDYIDGLITHDDIAEHASAEAALWLALIFDRGLFRRLLFFPIERRSWLPMLAVQRVAARIHRARSLRRHQRRLREIDRIPSTPEPDDDLPF